MSDKEVIGVLTLFTTFLLWLTPSSAQTNPKYLLTAPNILRFDVEESVVITILEATEPVQLELYLEESPLREWRTESVRELVEPGVPTEIKIKAPSDKSYTILEDRRYVVLVAKGTSNELEFEKEVEILVTPQNGFVFIQTDKPIYTPNQEVQVRIVQVDHLMKPRDTPIQIDVLNPKGIVVERKTDVSIPNGYYSKTFTFPALPNFGNWSISVHYGKEKKLNETVQFEVKEYVLPTFSVKVKTPEYILNKIYFIPVEVHAQYVFGKNVSGPVTIRLGVETENELKIFGTKTGRMSNAGYVTSFTTRDIQVLGADFWFLKGAKLYVEATVREQESGIQQVGKARNTVFVTAPYNIKLSRTRSFFKPGLSFTGEIDVTHVNGKPAKETGINVSTTFRNQNGEAIPPSFDAIELTNEKGQASVRVRPPSNAHTAVIQVLTHTDVAETEEFTLRSAFSSSGSYLLAEVKSEQPVAVGDAVRVEITATKPSDVSNLVYMVTSGGRSIKTGVIPGPSFPHQLSIPVVAYMSPSARLLVYYVHGNEVVSDSLQMDVADQCRNQVVVSTNKRQYKPKDFVTVEVKADPHTKVAMLAVDQAVYLMNSRHRLTPKKLFDTMESCDTGCGVGSGVNSDDLLQGMGLTVLSNADVQGFPRTAFGCSDHHILLRKKRRASPIPRRPWIGGSPDSVMTNSQCCAVGRQRRRGTCLERMGRELFGVSASCRTKFLKCCNEGPLRPQPNGPDFDTIQIAGRNQPTSTGRGPGGRLGHADPVTYQFEDIPALEEVIDKIPARENFDETWMFTELEVGADGKAIYRTTAPDSITTWVIQAFGINQNSGFCVAEPSSTKVFTEFFIQLSLPFSVIRQEQVEVRATIFNYGDNNLALAVYTIVGPGLCAKSRPGEPSDKIFARVESHNSTSVTFPVVPLDVGIHTIELIATSPLLDYSDRILKWLNVIPEGEPTIDVFNTILDPSGETLLSDQPSNEHVNSRRQMMSELPIQRDIIDLVPPPNAVPDSAQSSISAIGTMMGSVVTHAIEGVQDMMELPTGCGEQTMIKLAPTTYAALYLKNTGKLTPELQDKASEFIASGYSNELLFRKDSGAFSVFQEYPPGTWLTAFVNKVFSQSRAVPGVTIEDSVICSAISWLATKQREDGSFMEDQPVIHRQLTGASAEDISLAASVLISLAESDLHCEGTRGIVMENTVYYLENKLDDLSEPYLMSIVAYALKMADSSRSSEAYVRMKSLAQLNEASSTRWWSRGEHEHVTADDVETTSYALLSGLLHNDMDYVKPIVRWLNLNRGSRAAFKSTQDTVVALQALSQYSSKMEQNKAIQLHSRVVRQNDSVPVLEFDLTEENTVVQRHEELPHGLQYHVLTQGIGTGQLTAELQYNVFTNSTLCRFETSVTVEELKIPRDIRKIPDYEDEDFTCPGASSELLPGAVARIAYRPPPLPRRFSRFRSQSRFGGFHLPSRSRLLNQPFIDQPEPAGEILTEAELAPRLALMSARSGRSAISISKLRVCTKFLASRDTGMSIVEVGLFSGYEPVNASLARLKECNSTSFVMNYEITTRTVVFYLSKIPHDNEVCLEFFIQQLYRVGNTQPVAVNVKDYYHPNSKCTTFYHPNSGSELLRTICNKETGQCVCGEGRCPTCYNVNKNVRRLNPPNERPDELPIGMGGTTTADLKRKICDLSEVAYQVEILSIAIESGYNIIKGQVLYVLKQGYRDTPDGSLVTFWQRGSCQCNSLRPLFEVGKKYLVAGPEGMHFSDITNAHSITSSITDASYVVEWNDRASATNRKERRHAAKLAYVKRTGCSSHSFTSRFGRFPTPRVGRFPSPRIGRFYTSRYGRFPSSRVP